MMALRFPLPALLVAAFSLAGCAGSVSSYPSLAPRPIEKAAETPAVAAGAGSPDAAILARAAALGEQARRGDAAFTAAARAGCTAIDRGRDSAEGGEAWVAGQQALSAIEAEREPTAAALDELNALVLDQARLAEDAARPVDLSPLTQAVEAVGALDAAQAARLSVLREAGCKP